jgi:hypothetical protein
VFLLEVEFGCVLAAATAAKLPTMWLLSPELGELLLGVYWDNKNKKKKKKKRQLQSCKS